MKNKKLIILVVFLACLVPVIGVFAEKGGSGNASSGKESEVLTELKQIRTLLERIEKKLGSTPVAANSAQIKTAQISTKNRPALGDSKAPVTIVEVSDYECPFCKKFADNAYKELKKHYIDTGKVRLVYKDLPLSFHKQAKQAAQAAHCSGDQGQYWAMHDMLFANIKKYSKPDLINYSKQLDLDMKLFKTCINSNRHLAAIDKDVKDATKAGLRGTPSFVIGKTTGDLIKGDVVVGAHPISSLKKYIEKHL